jgi:hypothetical protein
MILAALVGAICVAVFCWQSDINPCQDGARYTSGKPQPTPFHRRFHAWPANLLTVVTWLSLVAIAAMMGTWQRAALLMTLPGIWMIAVMPTTVDAPAMALAYASSILLPVSPVAAILLSCVAGAIHERGPFFAALYCWSPWPLIGLVAVQWWAKQAPRDPDSPDLADVLVGHKSMLSAALAHRPYVDLLGEGGLIWSMRGVLPIAAYQGASWQAWVTFGLAFASRIVATDAARCLMWAAPPLVAHLDPPTWMVALHVMTFRRVMR